jgi:TolB protein
MKSPSGDVNLNTPVGQNAAYRPAEATKTPVAQDYYLALRCYNPSMRRILLLPLTLFLVLACTLPSDPPPALTIATLQAQASAIPTSPHPNVHPATAPPTVPAADGPRGKIVYTCQVAGNQLCLINADGTGFRQLTIDPVKHWYASLAPDGGSVVYSAYVEDYVYEIYELDLTNGETKQLTSELGVLKAPEISPDGKSIVFGLGTREGAEQVWVMERSGTNPHKVYGQGWDPTWSPDGLQILFASNKEGAIQFYIINLDGSDLRRVTNFDSLRGRSDWSPDGAWMVTYNGEVWKREVFIFRPDFSDLRQLTPSGGNSQGPSFSPDGKWVTFTAYFDHYGDDLGCEIYILRVDGTDLRRLTDNAWCDYQPRWGL